MQLKPEEISKVIRSQIKYYENAIRQDETGTVLMVGDGIARASGLSNCMAGELLEFERPVRREYVRRGDAPTVELRYQRGGFYEPAARGFF